MKPFFHAFLLAALFALSVQSQAQMHHDANQNDAIHGRDLSDYHPRQPADPTRLLEIVRNSSGAECNQAAMILAKSGHMDELLNLLKTTASYHTMQAIAQTRDERTIPIFESRLQQDPNNSYLIGSLAYVRNPKASKILGELLGKHPVPNEPSDYDLDGVLLNAVLLNRCHDEIPLLRERFKACHTKAQAERKSDYALTLLFLGDPVGMTWLKQKLGEDINSRVDISRTADRFCTFCEWMRQLDGFAMVEDETVMMPLLPELARGASDKNLAWSRECCRALKILTLHDFATGSPDWAKWYKEHKDRHPIYSTPLNQAAKECIVTFRGNLSKAAAKNEHLKWMDHFLGQPDNQWSYAQEYVWGLESHPEHSAFSTGDRLPMPPANLKELGLSYTISMTSKYHANDHELFRLDINALNITVALASSTPDRETRNELIAIARNSCKALSDYQNDCKAGRFQQARSKAF